MSSVDGAHVADFACAIIDNINGVFAWTMPRTTTGGLDPSGTYIYNIDVDDTVDSVTTDRALNGKITVRMGQVKAP